MKRAPSLSRRMFLGGAGAALGLPLLGGAWPGMGIGRAEAADPIRPQRVVFFIVSYGCAEYNSAVNAGVPGAFRPSTVGAGYGLTPCLAPLVNVKNDVSVFSGLHNRIAFEPPGYEEIDHPSLCQAILTGVSPLNTSYSVGSPSASISVDQVAANHLQAVTPGLPSLEIGTSVAGYQVDNYSWRDATTPMSRVTSPLDAFNRVFGGSPAGETSAAMAKRNHRRTRILDYAKGEIGRLQTKLGAADRQRLDQYLTSVDRLEKRIASQPTTQCASGGAPAPPRDIDEQATQMLDLIPLAFQCDRTRMVTFTLEANSEEVPCTYLPSPYSGFTHHGDLSHPGVDPVRLQGCVELSKWKVGHFAKLVEKLKATPEADGSGSLLDNTTVVYLSEMGYGDGHSPVDLPCLVAGRGGGAFNPGRHVVYDGQPVTNLYLNLLATLGMNVTKFGNSTGPLANV